MAHARTAHDPGKYYVPHGSKWPFVGSVSLFVMMHSAAALLNGVNLAPFVVWASFAWCCSCSSAGSATSSGKTRLGCTTRGGRSFRMGMMSFIFSEVMFFAAFFGALYYARELSVPWLGGEGAKCVRNLFLWKGFDGELAVQRSRRQSAAGFETIPAFGLPAINTAILLTSGVTITIAHHALQAGKRGILKVFLA